MNEQNILSKYQKELQLNKVRIIKFPVTKQMDIYSTIFKKWEWMGPGGLCGLQIRWLLPSGRSGGFDSLALPPKSVYSNSNPHLIYCKFKQFRVALGLKNE